MVLVGLFRSPATVSMPRARDRTAACSSGWTVDCLKIDVAIPEFLPKCVQGRRDRLEIAIGNPYGFGLFQAVASEIAHDHIVSTDHA
jgi:hypothetical protein